LDQILNMSLCRAANLLSRHWVESASLQRSEKIARHKVKVYSTLLDPVKVSADETLSSIMLLGLYEVSICTYEIVGLAANLGKTINCDSKLSMQSYYNHLSGATALVEVRGDEQYQSEIGFQLFVELRSQTVSIVLHDPNCLVGTQILPGPRLSRESRACACIHETMACKSPTWSQQWRDVSIWLDRHNFEALLCSCFL